LYEESAHGVVEHAKLWAREVKNYVVRNKGTMHGLVNKLGAIISLKAFNE
jgi:hypothetical protein